MPPLAAAIAEFHSIAEPRTDHGGKPGMAWVIEGNAAGFAEYGANVLDPLACRRLTEDCARRARQTWSVARRAACLGTRAAVPRRPALAQHRAPRRPADALRRRRVQRQDRLHRRSLRSRVSADGSLAPRTPSTRQRSLEPLLADTRDFSGLSLLPLFLSCRAAVRAKTSATAARLQPDVRRGNELQALAREYLAMAEGLLNPPRPCLIAIGGFSGTGKSTLALGLAPSVGAVPGAVVIRSDEIRKRLSGVSPLDRLGPEGYSSEMSERVYATVAERARLTIREGHSAIVDAVYARPADRQAIEHVAAEMAVPFVGIWLEAPEATLIARAEQRRNDASDADADVIRLQHAQQTGTMSWRRIEAWMHRGR